MADRKLTRAKELARFGDSVAEALKLANEFESENPDEIGIIVESARTPEDIVNNILKALQLAA